MIKQSIRLLRANNRHAPPTQTLLILPSRFFSTELDSAEEPRRSKLFARKGEESRMKDIREKMRREHDDDTRFNADLGQIKSKIYMGESTYERQKREGAYSTELIYSSDLQGVLSMFRR